MSTRATHSAWINRTRSFSRFAGNMEAFVAKSGTDTWRTSSSGGATMNSRSISIGKVIRSFHCAISRLSPTMRYRSLRVCWRNVINITTLHMGRGWNSYCGLIGQHRIFVRCVCGSAVATVVSKKAGALQICCCGGQLNVNRCASSGPKDR